MRPRDTTVKEGGSAGHAGTFTGPYLTSMEGGNASSMSGTYFALYMPRSCASMRPRDTVLPVHKKGQINWP